MFDFLNHTFMIYALLLGLFISVSAAMISPYIVLSNQSMIADGLSHIAFTGIIIGILVSSQPFYFAIPFSIIASILITFLGEQKMIEKDSAIGVISSFSLAIGLVVVSLSSGFNNSIEALLVGSILTVSLFDVIASILLLILITVFILIFYRKLLSITYDETYSRFKKVHYRLFKYLLSSLTAIFIVVGVRSVGMLLISTFIIFPSLIASQLSKSFFQTIILGIISAVFAVFVGVTTSYHLDIPTGSSIVLVYVVLLIISIGYRKLKKIT